MRSVDGKEYEILWADKEQNYLVIACATCSNIILGPSETFTAKQYDEVTDTHNSEPCNGATS